MQSVGMLRNASRTLRGLGTFLPMSCGSAGHWMYLPSGGSGSAAASGDLFSEPVEDADEKDETKKKAIKNVPVPFSSPMLLA